MNIVKVMGGLGNQLYQYAFGQLLMTQNPEVAYDLSWFDNIPKNNTVRSYCLDKFPIEVPVALEIKQPIITEYHFDSNWISYINHTFFGYWQYASLYLPILPQIQIQFCIKESLYTESYIKLRNHIKNNEVVSLHIRRGDYLTTSGFVVLPLCYYYEALTHVQGDLFIFSDDLPWCKKMFDSTFLNRKIFFIDLNEYLSFDLMRLCHHNIIANSSFSTWAALVNPNKDKKIITTKLPVSNTELEKNKKAYLPKDWILI